MFRIRISLYGGEEMNFRTEGLAELTERMCRCNTCSECPLKDEPGTICSFLRNSEMMNETLSKIKQWDDSHPFVSNMEKFKEVFDYHFSEMPEPRSSFWTEEFKGKRK